MKRKYQQLIFFLPPGISASTPPPSEPLREETLTPALPNLPDEASSQEEVEEAKEEVEVIGFRIPEK